jgi:hypothetical protein
LVIKSLTAASAIVSAWIFTVEVATNYFKNGWRLSFQDPPFPLKLLAMGVLSA